MLFGELKTEDTWWEMTKEQQTHFDQMAEINEYLREEYHSLKDILWMFDTYNILKKKIPVRYSLHHKNYVVVINLDLRGARMYVRVCLKK